LERFDDVALSCPPPKRKVFSGGRDLQKRTHMGDSEGLGRAYAEQAFAALFPNGIQALSQLDAAIAQINAKAQELVTGILQATARFAPLERESQALRELDNHLAPYGWFVPPSLEPAARAELLNLAMAEGGAPEVIIRLLDLTDAGLAERIVDRACEGWITKKRDALFHAALSAHERADYALSVPVLLAQVEGAYRNWLEAVGEQPDSPFRAAGALEFEAIRGLLTLSDLMLYEHLGSFAGAIPIQLAASVRTSTDLSRLKQKFPLGFLSRHAVMHGIDTDYGSRANSTKALFVVDVAVELFSAFEPSKGSSP
jgi:hypothetical protein